MKNEQKKKTIETLDIMIQQAEKGPSGFWVDDYEGCGNPKIFPEFEEGLKRGKLIQKEHYLCPWNTAVMYGKGHGNIQTGCYYSCSIGKAEFLSPKMLRSVLMRFKSNLKNVKYDNTDTLEPLLTDNEIKYIEDQETKQRNEAKERRQLLRKNRLKKPIH